MLVFFRHTLQLVKTLPARGQSCAIFEDFVEKTIALLICMDSDSTGWM